MNCHYSAQGDYKCTKPIKEAFALTAAQQKARLVAQMKAIEDAKIAEKKAQEAKAAADAKAAAAKAKADRDAAWKAATTSYRIPGTR
jgi:hypothetical protein